MIFKASIINIEILISRYENSVRIPLRDAVERRPIPDEPVNYRRLNDVNNSPYSVPYSYDLQQRLENFYSPLRYFDHLVNNYRLANPYRIGNSYQQLLVSPYGRSGRDLKFGTTDFFRSGEENKQSKFFI